MLTASLALRFTTPYIGNPYWPEVYHSIEITKKSGLSRARTDANRRKALEEHLRVKGMTLADYERIEALARRPFHTASDGEIVIPAARFLAFLVAANDTARAAFRSCPPSQVRSRIVASDFKTGKYEADGIWSRFVTVTLGTGARASNQRALREDSYIADFTATGTIRFDEQTVDPATLRRLIEWAGEFIGIGASRKMGKGRFRLEKFEVVGSQAAA